MIRGEYGTCCLPTVDPNEAFGSQSSYRLRGQKMIRVSFPLAELLSTRLCLYFKPFYTTYLN